MGFLGEDDDFSVPMPDLNIVTVDQRLRRLNSRVVVGRIDGYSGMEVAVYVDKKCAVLRQMMFPSIRYR